MRLLYYLMAVVRSKIVSRLGGVTRPQKLNRTMGLKEFYEKRNRILIFRGVGGLGDILMHRMMFHDFKRLMPDAELHFACPSYYHDAVRDHPLVSKVLDVTAVDRHDYVIHYNTTTICGRTEMRLAPLAGPHRSDIWASHCGVLLTKHDMQIRMTDEENTEGKALIEKVRDRPGPSVIVAPISAMTSKNMMDNHVIGVVNGLRDRGLCPIGLHNEPMWPFVKNDFPSLYHLKVRQWMSVISQADYVVSVDSAAFHCAGGMGKPLVGIFTWASSAAYGQYYHTSELIQGPCPLAHKGCYNWTACPKKTSSDDVPCRNDLSVDVILAGFDRLAARFPSVQSYVADKLKE